MKNKTPEKVDQGGKGGYLSHSMPIFLKLSRTTEK